MTDTLNPDQLVDHGELMLCLGQAFLYPEDPANDARLVELLTEDLAEINAGLGFTTDETLAELRGALAESAARDGGLKRLYSRLFLAPPFPAPINAGIHLDGSLMGKSVIGMETLYQRNGLEKDAEFRDLPDHLALQLQFMAWMLARAVEADEAGDTRERDRILLDARVFCEHYLCSWLPLFGNTLNMACEEGGVPAGYLMLGRVTHQASEKVRELLATLAPLEEPPEIEAESEVVALDEGDETAESVTCRLCGKAFAMDFQLAAMVKTLGEQGLDTEHLQTCSECRAEAMGLKESMPNIPQKWGGAGGKIT